MTVEQQLLSSSVGKRKMYVQFQELKRFTSGAEKNPNFLSYQRKIFQISHIYKYRMDEQGNGISNETEQVFIALCFFGKVLGMASFEELNNTIFCDSVSVSTDEMEDTLTNLKLEFKPTIFLLHPKIIANKSLLDLILSGIDGSPNEYRFKVLKSSIWNERSYHRLIHNCLVIRSGSNGIGASTFQQLSCMLNLESEQSRQAIGAVIAYMQETVYKLDGGQVVVSAVRKYTPKSFLRIDISSFNALQIFSEEIHPNVMKGKGRSKEGFSLFGLFDRTHSLPGRSRLKDWMARPYCDKVRIEHRQQGVAVTSRPCNRDFVVAISSLLRHFHDVPRLILRVKKVEATSSDWSKINTSLIAGCRMLESIEHFVNIPLTEHDDAAYLQDMCNLLNPAQLGQLATTLQSAIDFTETDANGSVVFREAYDQQLDHLRHVYDHLETHLVQAAHKILDIVPLLQVIYKLKFLYRFSVAV